MFLFHSENRFPLFPHESPFRKPCLQYVVAYLKSHACAYMQIEHLLLVNVLIKTLLSRNNFTNSAVPASTISISRNSGDKYKDKSLINRCVHVECVCVCVRAGVSAKEVRSRRHEYSIWSEIR